MRNIMNIDQAQEPEYESVKIDYVGFVDPYAVEGMVILKADNGKEFHMRAFSGEVVRHISSFGESPRFSEKIQNFKLKCLEFSSQNLSRSENSLKIADFKSKSVKIRKFT